MIMSDEEECVDFVSQFYPRFAHINAQIFSYLTAKQLTIISCVSKKWRNACKYDTKARKRKTIYLRMIKRLRKTVGEENWPLNKRIEDALTQNNITDTVSTATTTTMTSTSTTTTTTSTNTRIPFKSVINVYQTGNTSALSSIANSVNRNLKSR